MYRHAGRRNKECAREMCSCGETMDIRSSSRHVSLRSDVIFKSSKRARTKESDESNLLVSGSVSERVVHTNWKLKTDSATNLVTNTIEHNKYCLVSCNSNKLEPRRWLTVIRRLSVVLTKNGWLVSSSIPKNQRCGSTVLKDAKT